jgi:hypothetical protein
VDVADQAQEKDRDGRSFSRDRNWDSDKTDKDWRSSPAKTALMTTLLEEVMIALGTSIEIITIQTNIGMGIRMSIRMGIMTAHASIWIATEQGSL